MSRTKDSYTPEQWERLWNLFHAAIDIEPSARTPFLGAECSNDPQIRQEVEELLAALEEDSNIVEELATLGEEVRSHVTQEQSAPALQAGTILAQRFEIVRLLGKGGMGAVYEAVDLELDSVVAVKVLRSEIAAQPQVLERFRSEINLARRVTHSNVCRIFDLFRDQEGIVFLTMELLKGQTLTEYLWEHGPMKKEEALPIVEQIAAALTAAHQAGVVHRDLKTSNVLLVPEADRLRAVVTDFGLATSVAGKTKESGEDELFWGTPEYMAPEQRLGESITPATDIYAFGLVIYEMLIGRLPFTSDSTSSFAVEPASNPPESARPMIPGLDERWQQVLLRCFKKDPVGRFQKAAEVISALKPALLPDTPPRKGKRVLLALASMTFLGLALGIWILYFQKQSDGVKLDFQQRQWVLVCAFENTTGDPSLNGTVEYALQMELNNSKFVNVIPRERVEDVLRLMKKPTDTRVDAAVCREISLRDGEIRALIKGRVEKVGSGYSISSEIVEPVQNTSIFSLDTEADGESQVLPAVRRLSLLVREKLGEQISQVKQSEEKLESVTTKSLRALQLFSKADAVIATTMENNKTAEALLREAISEDPDFASAYLHLAWAIGNQMRPKKDFLPYAERALQLSANVSEREGYFIRGSYYQMTDNLEEALKNYQVLLHLYPDHFWANNNVAGVLRQLSRSEEAYTYVRRSANLRPNDVGRNVNAGQFLILSVGRVIEAEPYLQRAIRLAGSLPAEQQNKLLAEWWLDVSKIHELWLQGSVRPMLELMDRWKARLPSLADDPRFYLLYSFLHTHYCYLGRFEQSKETVMSVPADDFRLYYLRQIKLAQSKVDEWKRIVPTVREDPSADEALLWARAGLQRQARKMLTAVEKTESKSAVYKTAQGTIYLANGENAKAIPLLTQGLQHQGPSMAPYFEASGSLAQAWLREGKLEIAVQVLEKASQQKHKALWGKLDWMRIQLQLADLYRQQGRQPEAEKIEAELRKLLTYADPDFWMVQELNHRMNTVPR